MPSTLYYTTSFLLSYKNVQKLHVCFTLTLYPDPQSIESGSNPDTDPDSQPWCKQL
jgi:hypothetical protein